MSDYLKQVWLGTRLEPGSRLLPILTNAFRDVDEIYAASAAQIESLLGKRRAAIRALSNKSLADAERLLELCAARNIRLITYFDRHYPSRLRRLANPPALLFVRGSLPDLDSTAAVSVVGTREPSEYAMEQTYGISYGLASVGVRTVSGLAFGIDGVAAAATLAAKGKTVAVLGSGLDVIYPKQHTALAEMISETGCLLSEYPPGEFPEKWNFPIRNRIIAALGDATLVTAGSLRSGALITAKYANELEIPVFALPGRVDIPEGQGTALLLRQGARLAATADDILALLCKEYPTQLDPTALADAPALPLSEARLRYRIACRSSRAFGLRRKAHREQPTSEPKGTKSELPTLSPTERAVLERIPSERECHPDELTDNTLTVSEIGAALTMLEIYGIIETAPGGRIRRKL